MEDKATQKLTQYDESVKLILKYSATCRYEESENGPLTSHIPADDTQL
jgi:hypothetical protein